MSRRVERARDRDCWNSPTGLVINPIYDTSVLTASNAAQIEAAVAADIRTVETTYSSNAILNLHIGWGEVGGSPVSHGSGGCEPHPLARDLRL